MNFLTGLLSAIGKLLGFLKSRSDAHNAPDVKAAAKAQAEVDAVNQTEQVVAKKDTNETRNQLAE